MNRKYEKEAEKTWIEFEKIYQKGKLLKKIEKYSKIFEREKEGIASYNQTLEEKATFSEEKFEKFCKLYKDGLHMLTQTDKEITEDLY